MNDIEKICEKYNIFNYKINKDNSIDVQESVDLSSCGLKKIPIKFNKVLGNFHVSYNSLKDLENSPNLVYGDFNCNYNKLTSLKGSPRSIWGDFDCSNNKELKSIDFLPKIIYRSFYIIKTGVEDIYNESLINNSIFYDRHLSGLKFIGYETINHKEWLLSEKRKRNIGKILNKKHLT